MPVATGAWRVHYGSDDADRDKVDFLRRQCERGWMERRRILEF